MNKIDKFKKFLKDNGYNNEITEEDGKIKVGGSLDLRGTNITELPDNLMVEGSIYGFNTDNIVSVKKVLKGYNKELNYIYFDGILWGNVKSVKKVDNITIYKTPLGYCAEIKKTGKVTRMQYRAITGACQFGTEQFCKQHGIEDLEEISLEELRKILTPDNYGARKFWELIDG